MNLLSSRTFTIVVSLVFSATLFNTVLAQNQDKLLLSEAIREAIDTNGSEAAKERFADMNKSQRDRYQVDMDGISELTNSYLEAGDYEAITAISEISAPFMQDMISESMNDYSPEMTEMMSSQQNDNKQQANEREQERKTRRQERIVESQGQPRNDLERFTGLFAGPEAGDSPRQLLWVTVSCDGYLVSGAMWGDAAPWWLRSESDNVFTHEDSFNNLRMEFKTGADGRAVEMSHDLDFLESPLKRVGPLPDDWSSCLERM